MITELIALGVIILIIRLLYRTSIFNISKNWVTHLQEKFHIHNIYKIPQYNEFSQENLLFRKISTYIKSLHSVEESDYAALYSGDKPGDVLVSLGPDQTVIDTFLDVQLKWTYNQHENVQGAVLMLRVKSRDKKRILAPYIQHIYKVVDEIELRKKELRVYLNNCQTGKWRSFPFVHPSTFDTIVLDNEVKNKVKNDLEQYLKSKQYYSKIGRVWRRSYLLYGGSGTGKSSFAAAMSKMISYDLYDLDLSKVSNGSDLKTLLLQTSRKSLILVENLDMYLMGSSASVSLTAVLNYMDGVVSSCGDERVMVFTMNCKNHIDPMVLRPGRVDVHIYFPFCDFNVFKALALSHLGIKEHKLFGQVEELLQGGTRVISPAEISEIMISNRMSSSRAIKTIIKTLQNDKGNIEQGGNNAIDRERVSGDSDESGSGNKREGSIAMQEIRKLYGIMKLRNSRRQESLDLS
ncbi:AAA-ATPase At2g46620-like [Silene latifolia]|uniref:AAA-ATPase At2g46620-like n=1 Tax=Silene latifolia TaxID=37657 RepID=UPI003D76BAED